MRANPFEQETAARMYAFEISSLSTRGFEAEFKFDAHLQMFEWLRYLHRQQEKAVPSKAVCFERAYTSMYESFTA